MHIVQRARKEAILPQVPAASVESIDVLGAFGVVSNRSNMGYTRDGPYFIFFRTSALFDFLGRPEGNGRRRRPKRVSNFATNLSLPNGRPRLVHRRNRASCRSSSARVNKCRHRCVSICLFHCDTSSRPVGSLPSQWAAALLQGQRHALRRSRARTGLRSMYTSARQ